MRELLTAERVDELVALPKRVVRATEFAWRPLGNPGADGGPPGDTSRKHHKIMRIRLIAVDGRETFELVATSNDKFSMTLKYRDIQLARLCCSRVHRIPRRLGGGTVKGPHVHYHRPGFGEKYAVGTDGYSHDDVNGALSFFLELCGVTGIPPLQEMLDLI